MDRKEWLRKLKSELHKLPKNEVEDALNYYNEYFDEAGPEHEEEILIELGSPTRVATQIKADYAVRQLDEESKVGGSHFRLGRVGSVVAAAIAGILAAPIALPIAFVLIGVAEALHHFPGLEFLGAAEGPGLLWQLPLLAAAILAFALGTLLACRRAERRFEALDL